MSRQSDAKNKQGYQAKPTPHICSTCKHFQFDRVQTQAPSTWNPNGYFEDKNLRCGMGGFAVKKTAACNEWELKPADSIEEPA